MVRRKSAMERVLGEQGERVGGGGRRRKKRRKKRKIRRRGRTR